MKILADVWATAGKARGRAAGERLEARVRRLAREEKRQVDAYQSGRLDKATFGERQAILQMLIERIIPLQGVQVEYGVGP